VIALLLLTLLLVCIVAPWMGADTSDSRAEHARPDQGWFPLLRDAAR
jgi:hypothetical protein